MTLYQPINPFPALGLAAARDPVTRRPAPRKGPDATRSVTANPG